MALFGLSSRLLDQVILRRHIDSLLLRSCARSRVGEFLSANTFFESAILASVACGSWHWCCHWIVWCAAYVKTTHLNDIMRQVEALEGRRRWFIQKSEEANELPHAHTNIAFSDLKLLKLVSFDKFCRPVGSKRLYNANVAIFSEECCQAGASQPRS